MDNLKNIEGKSKTEIMKLQTLLELQQKKIDGLNVFITNTMKQVTELKNKKMMWMTIMAVVFLVVCGIFYSQFNSSSSEHGSTTMSISDSLAADIGDGGAYIVILCATITGGLIPVTFIGMFTTKRYNILLKPLMASLEKAEIEKKSEELKYGELKRDLSDVRNDDLNIMNES